jgi:hypothetical protein
MRPIADRLRSTCPAQSRGFRQITLTHVRRRLVVAVPPTFAAQWFSPRLGALAVEPPDVELSIRTGPSADCHCSIRFARLELWPSWLAKAGLPVRYAKTGIDFPPLERAIRAASKGAGRWSNGT